MEFIAIVLGVALGNLIWKYVKEQHSYRYKWKCPVCESFTASASNKDIIERVKATHVHEEE